MKANTIITRHPAFAEYVREIGLASPEAVVVPHASPEALKGKHVLTSGLPLHLAALASAVTTVPLNLPAELRGVELTLAQVTEHAAPAATFKVEQV